MVTFQHSSTNSFTLYTFGIVMWVNHHTSRANPALEQGFVTPVLALLLNHKCETCLYPGLNVSFKTMTTWVKCSVKCPVVVSRWVGREEKGLCLVELKV